MTTAGGKPKLGAKLGHSKPRAWTQPGDGSARTWPMPEGDWTPQAVAWWQTVTASLSAEMAWLDEDRPAVERLLWMVDAWWRMTQSSPTEAMRTADAIRRFEASLYLGPAERAKAGITPSTTPKRAAASTSSRDRLRAVDAG